MNKSPSRLASKRWSMWLGRLRLCGVGATLASFFKRASLSLSSTSHWEANSFLSTVSQNALGAFSPSRRSSGVTARRGREGVRALLCKSSVCKI